MLRNTYSGSYNSNIIVKIKSTFNFLKCDNIVIHSRIIPIFFSGRFPTNMTF